MRSSKRAAFGAWLLWLAFVVGAPASGQQPPRQLRPVDEGTIDASFAAFRSALIAALKDSDRQFIERIIDRNISVSFGPDDGEAEFRKQWNLRDRSGPFWKTMLDTVSLGGQFVTRDQFCAPYVYTAFPPDLDASSHVVVLRENVPLRRAAALDSAEIATLDYSILRRVDAAPGSAWTRVMAGAQEGFVPSAMIRSPVEYRACFDRAATGWRLTAFISGD